MGWDDAPTSVDCLFRSGKFPPAEVKIIQRVTPYIGEVLLLVEEDLKNFFLLALFQGATFEVPSREITCLPVNQVGLSIPNPTLTA